ncbi:putative type II/III system pilus formation protein [Roseibium hamelinense]|uniref:Putative type II/III system pilus formation protein n=1 Tax=Roseibium hamelinense TaxID=150831 RepID=A0A562SIK2_9HYPH|nr:pilus assembly protein N-terminal domain-containing protein [Roseibium hamelinense]MTI43921.1 pilus assembly protein [Roseibium hamelinense]TWI80784.1 putative type II/III system pilus formation protein [Roseibium hamelinense]
MFKRRARDLLFCTVVLTITGGWLQQNAVAQSSSVSVEIDRATVYRIEDNASTIIIGNPLIADVSLQDRTTVVITGKSYGSTNLIILGEDGTPIVDETIVVSANQQNIISVTRKTDRFSYSCTPSCEPVIRLGDSAAAFDAASAQATTKNTLATTAAGGQN